MKSIFSTILVIGSLFISKNIQAAARTLNMPEFTSTFHNYSKVPLDKISVTIYYSCSVAPLDFGGSKPCGSTKSKAILTSLDAEGEMIRLTFPHLTFKSEGVSILKRNLIDFTANITVTIDGKIHRTNFGTRNNYWTVTNSNWAKSFIDEIQDISYISMEQKRLSFSLNNGKNAVDEIRNRFNPGDILYIYVKSDVVTYVNTSAIATHPNEFGQDLMKASFDEVRVIILNAQNNPTFKFSRETHIAPHDWRNYNWGASWRSMDEKNYEFKLSELQNGWPEELAQFEINENWVKKNN